MTLNTFHILFFVHDAVFLLYLVFFGATENRGPSKWPRFYKRLLLGPVGLCPLDKPISISISLISTGPGGVLSGGTLLPERDTPAVRNGQHVIPEREKAKSSLKCKKRRNLPMVGICGMYNLSLRKPSIKPSSIKQWAGISVSGRPSRTEREGPPVRNGKQLRNREKLLSGNGKTRPCESK